MLAQEEATSAGNGVDGARERLRALTAVGLRAMALPADVDASTNRLTCRLRADSPRPPQEVQQCPSQLRCIRGPLRGSELKYDVLAFLETSHLPFARILLASKTSAQFSHA